VSRYEWPGGEAGSGSPDLVTERLQWLQSRYGAVPPETLVAARAARRSSAATRILADRPFGTSLLWLPAGPATVLGGQAESSPRVSGRVRDIAVSADGTRAYAATANGGIWYTDDSGASWLQVGGWATRRAGAAGGEAASGAEGLTFGSLLVTFGGTANGDEVFAATGEISGRVQRKGHFGGVGVLYAKGPVPPVVADERADPWTVEGGALLTGLGSYRLAVDPHTPLGNAAQPAHLLLGTSNGLFERTSPGASPTWAKVTAGPFGRATDPEKPLHVTDIRWIPKGAGSRVWVGVDDRTKGGGGSSLWWADVTADGRIGAWTQVSLTMTVPAPGTPITYGGRIGLADSPAAPGILYALSVAGPWNTATPAMWRIDDTVAPPAVASVTNVPPRIFDPSGSGAGQQGYDLTIAADPAVAGQLIIGGGALEVTANDWNAALWLVQVQAAGPTGWQLSFTPPAPPPALPAQQPPVQAYNGTQDPTYIGAGVHADVHCASWTTSQAVGARHVWIGCDGGVYRSAAEGALHTFLARNTAIGSLEAGWIASNPASLHDIVIGTQDNGTIRRAGDAVWRAAFLGDGGGVAFFTSTTAQYVAQYVQASWQDNLGHPWLFVLRGASPPPADQTQENNASMFYSGAAATVDAGVTRVAVGTTRVWCTQDGGRTFFTLPSGLDPKRSPGPNPADTATDSCVLTGGVPSADGQVVTLRWATPRRLVVLCQRAVLVHDLVGGTAAVPPTSTVKRIDGAGARGKKNRLKAGVLPPAGSWTDIGIANPAAPGDGTLYVATTGPEKPSTSKDDETLWWYDGSAQWKRTGLRAAGLANPPNGTVAPAYAVVTDPASPATVYVGTGAGVWQGTRTDSATGPTWNWQPLVDGLPEATVTDLEIVSQGGVRLLRATVSAAGVWELDLSGTTANQLFLRVHDRDTRRLLPTPPTDTATLPPAPVRFDASPDLRVRNAPGTTVPAPGHATLPMSAQPAGASVSQRLALHELWVLQTAMHAHDPLVRPNGQWSPEFVSRLVAAGAPTTGPNQPRVTLPFWTAQLAAGTPYADPWDTPAPTEADLMELIVDRPVATGSAASGLVAGPSRVDVLVHRRSAPDPQAEVPWVLLIRRQVTGASAAWAALAVPWAAAVTAAVPTGAPPAAPLGDSWQVAAAMQQPTGSLTARTPRSVTFAVDFSTAPAGSQWLLVAVAGSASDPPVIPAGTLGPAVMGSRHLACRSIRIRG